MAGKSTYEILKEELGVMEDGMKRLSTTKEDIWQDELVWWLCKAVKDLLLYVIGDIERKRIKEENRA
jgi:hypothetical protein